MVTTDAVNFFLSRPRRFGKSLLVDTLRCYFEGRKELFEGLAIYELEKEWRKYPVIHLDLSNGKYFEEKSVHGTINTILKWQEQQFGITNPEDPTNYGSRLTNMIRAAYQQTGDPDNVQPATYRTLYKNSTGDDVTLLQRKLVQLGYLERITGTYDDETVEAVKAFQRKNGLTADGVAGERTLVILFGY